MVTDEMIEKGAKALGAGDWDKGVNDHDMWRREARAVLEAALSTDAEPVAWWWGDATGCMHIVMDRPDVHEAAAVVGCEPKPLYAEPAKTAPAVAVKALQFYAEYFEKDTLGDFAREALSALSAQVQDVAVPGAKPENKVEPDRSKFPYVWEGPKPDDAIVHKVINAYMGAQDREYDIDQFRYYKANWQWHYTLNQHMKAAVDACTSPASKHGGR